MIGVLLTKGTAPWTKYGPFGLTAILLLLIPFAICPRISGEGQGERLAEVRGDAIS
jgi:hypothetical protein